MSCLQIALNRLGIKYDNYYASEIDKYATQVTQHNYPNTIQLGDITKWKDWDLPYIDLIAGGSPCQGFSVAGKRLNFDDPRSKLYFVFEDIVKHYKPDYWLLENVVMLQEHQDTISQRLGIKPIKINSALVSAQNRERLYWTNIENEMDLFGFPYCNIQQPKDKHIYLKDIIEDGFVNRDKSLCLVSNSLSNDSRTAKNRYFDKALGQIVFNQPVLVDTINSSQDGKIVSVYGKSYTLTAGHNNYPKIAIHQVPRGNNKGGIRARDGKTPSLTSSNWEHNNHLVIQGAAKRARGGQKLELNFSQKSNAIISNRDKSLISDGIEHRKLTPLECERLQTMPDNFSLVLEEGKQKVSNSQRYKMISNGWTIDIICHILSHM